MTVTEEKLDEMLKELEDINKSIASPSSSSSDDENGNCEFMTSTELLFALFVWEAINQYCNYIIHTQLLYSCILCILGCKGDVLQMCLLQRKLN